MKDNELSKKVKDLGVKEVDISLIERNPDQPRKEFNQEKLKELADNISKNGLLQAIVVRKKNNKLIIIAGERRYRAHLLLNKKKIKARIIECDDKTAYELSLLENIQREDLNLLEVAKGYKYLIDNYGYKLNDLVKVTSKSKSNISNILSILREDEKVLEYIDKGILTLALYVHLKALPNTHEKLVLLKALEDERIKRSQVNDYIKRIVRAYKYNKILGINNEKAREQVGKGNRFDLKMGIVPEDFKYYVVGIPQLDAQSLQYIPSKRVLFSSYGIIRDKSMAKTFVSFYSRKEDLEGIFLDSGSFACMRRKDWKFFDNPQVLIDFYESIKPSICTALDIPSFPFLFKHWGISSKEVIDKTLKNIEYFFKWKPSFKTIKVYALQGKTAEEYLDLFYKYIKLGLFEEDNTAIAFGGIATLGFETQKSLIDPVVADREWQRLRPRMKFVHGFGVGNPKRMVYFYNKGLDSFDSATSLILAIMGKYWLRDGSTASHIIHEYRISRKLRMYFNLVSQWGQLVQEFADYRGIKFTEEKEKIELEKIKDYAIQE